MKKNVLKESTLEELRIRSTTSKAVAWMTIAGILLFFGMIHYPLLKEGKIDMEVVLPLAFILSVLLVGLFVETRRINSEIRSRS